MKRFTIAPLLLMLVLLVRPGVAAAQALHTDYKGATALGLELRRLGTTKRVLMIGAHPDDERTQVLSTLALGHGAEAAYLALSRGEGGQNGIGSELQAGLGLLRTEELLAARRLDGARQFFSRAYDFGFSKTADESFEHWPRDSVLADAVAVIRAFRPDVVITVFTGTPRDGHGQHQVAGIIAREAFAAAGDPNRFPEQIAAGLEPFAPAKLYQAQWGGDSAAHLSLATGVYDPLLGLSYAEIANESRSQHRSQDMGQALRPGPDASALQLLDVNGDLDHPVKNLFDGIDTTFTKRLVDRDGGDSRVAKLLGEYQDGVARALADFNPLEPGRVARDLALALPSLYAADSLTAASDTDMKFVLDAERSEAEDAFWRAQGLVLDAVADDETVVPGQQFTLAISLWNGGEGAVSPTRLEPSLPAGWTARAIDPLPSTIEPGALVSRRFTVSVPEDADLTQPYFLESPRNGDLYTWPSDVHVGVPFEPAAVRVRAGVVADGTPVSTSLDATFREVDKRRGELRRPIRVVPAVSVLLNPTLAVVPLGTDRASAPLSFTVSLRGEAPVSGTLRLDAPAGWRIEPADTAVTFKAAGEERAFEFSLVPPASLAPGQAPVSAEFTTENGASYTSGYTLVDYPNNQPRALYRKAAAELRAFNVNIAPGLRVGYVAGAGDDAPEALRQMGVSVVPLTADSLATSDLSRFDAIVTGIRAYEVRPDLVAHNQRVLNYVRNGGTLVVQYNKYEYTAPGIAPYPVEMARPHDRITDETADVRLLDPDSQALSWPNRITAADFQGWVQERSLYDLHTWDDHYVPLLEMADPGEAPQRGILMVAPLGQGTYVYTGLALFRQLPAGVPGAYRILANLVSLGARE